MKKKKQCDKKKMSETKSMSSKTRINKSIKGRKIEINEFLCSNSQQSLNSLNFPIELSEDLRKKKRKKITFDKKRFNEDCIESINTQIKKNFNKNKFKSIKEKKKKKNNLKKLKSPEKKITKKSNRKIRPKKKEQQIRLTAQTLKSIKNSLGRTFRDKQIESKLDEIIKLVKNKYKSQQELTTLKMKKEKQNFKIDEQFQKVLKQMKKIKNFQKEKLAAHIHIKQNSNDIQQLIKKESQENKKFIEQQFIKFQEKQQFIESKKILIRKQSIIEQNKLFKLSNKESQDHLDKKFQKINQFYLNQLKQLKEQQDSLKTLFENKIDNITDIFNKKKRSLKQQNISSLQWSFSKQKIQLISEQNYKFYYTKKNENQYKPISDPLIYFQKKKSIETITNNNHQQIQNTNNKKQSEQNSDILDDFNQRNSKNFNDQNSSINQKLLLEFFSNYSDTVIHQSIEEFLNEYIRDLIDKQRVQIKQNTHTYILTNESIRQFLYLFFEQITDQLAMILINNLNTNYGISLHLQLQILKTNEFIDNSITTEVQQRPVIPKNEIDKIKKILSNHFKYDQNSQNLICDCLQEILCSWRRYSLFSEPMNWRIRLGQCYQPVIEITKLISILEISLEKVIEWQSFRCGMLSSALNLDQYSQTSCDKEEDREQCLQKYLQWEVLESEDQWIDYEKAQIQTMFFIENLIFDNIIDDLVYFLSNNQIFQQ